MLKSVFKVYKFVNNGIDKSLKVAGYRKWTKEELAEIERTLAIKRQQVIEMLEIKQTWRVCFGDDVPVDKKDVFEVKDLLPRDFWFEDSILFTTIQAFRPEENYHDVSSYCLKWQPPYSSHKLVVPLEDPEAQENAMNTIALYPPPVRKNILFHFTTHTPFVPLFGERIHPSSKVSYRTKAEVFQRLCKNYLDGRQTLVDFENTMACDFDVWKATVFNMLTEEEQAFHQYLVYKPPVVVTIKDVENKYLDDVISLDEYEVFKYPDRKRLKDLHKLRWPQPYAEGLCVVCQNFLGKGIIKCFNCPNMICRHCLEINFLEERTKQGSFLLMHRRYCVKQGGLLQICPEPVQEPGYLKELRQYGRAAAIARLEANAKEREVLFSDDEESVDEEEIERERARLEAERLEAERKARENPPALQELAEHFKTRHHKFLRHRRDLLHCQGKIEEPGHVDNYYERQRRVRGEEAEKLQKMLPHVAKIAKKVAGLRLDGEPSRALLREVDLCLVSLELLLKMEGCAAFFEDERLGQQRLLREKYGEGVEEEEEDLAAIASADADEGAPASREGSAAEARE